MQNIIEQQKAELLIIKKLMEYHLGKKNGKRSEFEKMLEKQKQILEILEILERAF